MDQDLVVTYILIANGQPFGPATPYAVEISSQRLFAQLRAAIYAQLQNLFGQTDEGYLKIFLAKPEGEGSSQLEATIRSLEEDRSGNLIKIQELGTEPKRYLDVLGSYFPRQPDLEKIHLIVDCTNAGELRATLRSR
jgi:Crinkler effector protein N-terminal domain